MTTTAISPADNSYLDALRQSGAQSANSATTPSNTTINEAGFLKLLTTQMTNQDPTAPMDTNTMVTQLAQMSTVSGVTEMNSSLQSLVTELTGNRIGDAASWIGKSALVSSTVAQPLADGSYAGTVTLPSDATSVSLSLVDQNGNSVYSQTLANQKAGAIPFAWSGKAADGSAVTGPLQVVVSAAGTSGAITPTVSTWATVTGVQSPAGGSAAQLSTSLGLVAPADVERLS